MAKSSCFSVIHKAKCISFNSLLSPRHSFQLKDLKQFVLFSELSAIFSILQRGIHGTNDTYYINYRAVIVIVVVVVVVITLSFRILCLRRVSIHQIFIYNCMILHLVSSCHIIHLHIPNKN